MDRNEAQARWVLARGWLDERAAAWVLEQTRRHPELSFCDVLARYRAISPEAIAAIRRCSSGEIPAFQLPAPIPMESLVAAPSAASGSSLEAPTVHVQAPTAAGERLFGRYQILEELGRGAMGVVLRARDSESGREVAIKMLHQEQLQADELARFEREARALLALKHRHILELIDCGVEDGRPYLATEYIDGADLQQRVSEALTETTAPPPWFEVVSIFEDIARALERCHEAGVLHRDVKPQNIFIEAATGRAVLVDFGLMKSALEGDSSASRLTRTGFMVGTPLYMSPEQFNPDGAWGPVTAASDVWGFGAALFFALTGRPPYPYHSPMEIIRAIQGEKAPRARAFNRDVPPWLDELCASCLRRKPDRRPTMSEVAARLAAGEPRGASASARTLIAAAAALLVLGGLAAAYFVSAGAPSSAGESAGRRSEAPRRLALAPRESDEARRRRQRLTELGYPRAARAEVEELVAALSGDEAERSALLALCDRGLWSVSAAEAQDRVIALIERRLGEEFRPGATRRYSAGGQSLRVASFVHSKTGYELKLIPGAFHRFDTWEDGAAQERVQVLEPLVNSGGDALLLFFAFWQYEPKLGLRVLARRLLPRSDAGRRLEQQLQALERSAGGDEQAAFQVEVQVSQRLAGFFAAPDQWEVLRGVIRDELRSAREQAGEAIHSAYVRPFLLGTFELSVGDWLALLPQPALPANTTWEPPCGPETTAIGISEAAAGAWLATAGGGLRLPSRLEWEYAAAAGTETRYFWGDDPRQAERRCYGHSALRWEGRRNRVTAEGKRILLWPPARCDDVLQANAFGLYSMIGNVEEWCRPVDARGAVKRGAGLAMGGHMRLPEAYMSSRYFSRSRVRLGGLRAARSLP